ncbi:MAG: hypothetical protein WCP31_07720 [Chloroflexales bacterium]
MSTANFTTIRIDSLLDALVEALDAARVNAAADSRWITAIDTGADWLLQQEEISYDFASHALKVSSASRPDHAYVANGACQCEAFAKHSACWHRAAARLIRRALAIELGRTSPFALTAPTAPTAREAIDPSTGLPYEPTQAEAAFARRFISGKTAEEELLECFA